MKYLSVNKAVLATLQVNDPCDIMNSLAFVSNLSESLEMHCETLFRVTWHLKAVMKLCGGKNCLPQECYQNKAPR